MLHILTFMKFVEFVKRNDAILENTDARLINVEASGSLGLYIAGKCKKTYPNSTIISNKNLDWCSNIAPSKKESDKPWIMYSINGEAMKLTGFSVRNGCCFGVHCCCSEDGKVFDYRCCCNLFSFSLHGSNDNKTWKHIYKVTKDDDFLYCQTKTYEFQETESFIYIKLVMDEPWPGCYSCMQINQLEFYGKTTASEFSFNDQDENDESVSIIGKVKRNENE